VPKAPVTIVSLETAKRAASPATRPDRLARYRNIKVKNKYLPIVHFEKKNILLMEMKIIINLIITYMVNYDKLLGNFLRLVK